MNRFEILFYFYESKLAQIIHEQKFDSKDFFLTGIYKAEEVPPSETHVDFMFLGEFFQRIIYIPSDRIMNAPACSFDGKMIKKFKKNWYLCRENER